MQLRARDGRALLIGAPDNAATDALDDSAAPPREVDPHNLPLGADLADALHEWARVAQAIHRNSPGTEGVGAQLISRRGRQLAGRVAAVMGRPISYVDPLTGAVTEIDVPEPGGPPRRTASIGSADVTDRGTTAAHEPEPASTKPAEPTPWTTGLTVATIIAILAVIIVVALSLALGEKSRWLALIANMVIAVGLAPSVWLARRAPVWRWIALGVVIGIGVGWVALLFTAL